MKVAMLTYGSRGDVQPYLAVADQLRANGHTVVFATPVNLAETVSAGGFETASIPIDSQAFLSSDEGRQFLANGRTTTFLRRLAEEETAKRDGLDEALIEASAGADVVVTGILALTRAAAITQRSGQPLVVLSTLPFEPTGDFACPYLVQGDLPTRAARRASHRLFLRLFSLSGRANVAAMRSRLGAPGRPPDVFRRLRRDATPIVHMISPQLLPRPRDWPDHCTLAGDVPVPAHLRAAWGEADLDDELMAWLDTGPPPVFMGFGSMPVLEPAASLRMIDDVAARCGVRALVGAGWSDVPAGERPGGRLFIASAFDHDRVLPRCSAAVHHGGAGTTHAALRAGLPAVVAHVFADQILWGRQVTSRRVGATMPYRRLNADRLTAALAPLLDDDVARRASSLADAMAHERGAAVAADTIEATAGLSHSSAAAAPPTRSWVPVAKGGQSAPRHVSTSHPRQPLAARWARSTSVSSRRTRKPFGEPGWRAPSPMPIGQLGVGPGADDRAVTLFASTVELASGLELSYAETGTGSSSVVVLLPGPTDSWPSYGPTLRLFDSSIRAIAVSQRGHGDSDKPVTGYRVEDFGADVVCLLDALDIERAVVAGHSGSCLTARRVAVDHPERIAGLVLEASPTTLKGHRGLEEFVGGLVSSLEDPIEPAFARSVLTDTSSDKLPPELVDELVNELVKVPARVWKEMFAALLSYDDLAELDRITVPTLMVWGDADGLVGRDMQDTLAQRICGAELLVYQGVGHTPRLEDPARFAADVAAFVKRLPHL